MKSVVRLKNCFIIAASNRSLSLVKLEFPKLNVICPSDAVAAILKGAVMYGHNPELISERICPRTYGITVDVPFDDRKHPRRLKTFSTVQLRKF
jgi:hypothetical protein